MAESEAHKLLKGRARQELKKAGFENKEIFEEHWIGKEYRIDIVGEKRGKAIAYECGNTTIDKLKDLAKLFDKVIWIPYIFSRKSSGLHRKGSKLKRRYKKNIFSGVVRIPSAVQREILGNNSVIMCESLYAMAIYSSSEDKKKVIRSLQTIIRDLKQEEGGEEDGRE